MGKTPREHASSLSSSDHDGLECVRGSCAIAMPAFGIQVEVQEGTSWQQKSHSGSRTESLKNHSHVTI